MTHLHRANYEKLLCGTYRRAAQGNVMGKVLVTCVACVQVYWGLRAHERKSLFVVLEKDPT